MSELESKIKEIRNRYEDERQAAKKIEADLLKECEAECLKKEEQLCRDLRKVKSEIEAAYAEKMRVLREELVEESRRIENECGKSIDKSQGRMLVEIQQLKARLGGKTDDVQRVSRAVRRRHNPKQ